MVRPEPPLSDQGGRFDSLDRSSSAQDIRRSNVGISVGMVTINTSDPQRLANFWTAALGLTVELDIGDYVYLNRPTGGIALSFQRVPDPAPTGSRVHLDLSVDDPIDPANSHASRRAAVTRL